MVIEVAQHAATDKVVRIPQAFKGANEGTDAQVCWQGAAGGRVQLSVEPQKRKHHHHECRVCLLGSYAAVNLGSCTDNDGVEKGGIRQRKMLNGADQFLHVVDQVRGPGDLFEVGLHQTRMM